MQKFDMKHLRIQGDGDKYWGNRLLVVFSDFNVLLHGYVKEINILVLKRMR
jgi:hypothetical protein